MTDASAHDVPAVLTGVREVAASRIAPGAAELDRTRAFPDDDLRALAGVGALGLVVPAAHGGAGGGLAELTEACEVVGAASASTGMVFLMHSVTAATVAASGDSAGELLGRLASGEALGTLAFSERGTGAHFYSPELRAERSNRSVSISGRKSFVTSGGHADVMLVLVQSADGEGLDCYAVERDAPGVAFDGAWNGIGMAGNSSIAMTLDGVTVDDHASIGAPGAGADLVFGVVAPAFLAGLAGMNVGISQAATTAATEHAASRAYPDGGTLAELPTIQHLLADMDVAVRSARLLAREAAALGDAGDEAALVALMEAKVSACDTAPRVTQQALEVGGGQAYTPSLPIERYLRDARAGSVMAPTNGVLKTWIGKALAGLPVP